MPYGDYLLYDPPSYADYSGTAYVAMEARVWLWDTVFVGGGMKSYFWWHDGKYSFWPCVLDSGFEVGVAWKMLEAGFRHQCAHPVLPYLLPYSYEPDWNYEGNYLEIYLRLEGKVGGKRR